MTTRHEPPAADEPGGSQESTGAKRVSGRDWSEATQQYLERLIREAGLTYSQVEQRCSLEPGTIERWQHRPGKVPTLAYFEVGEFLAALTSRSVSDFFLDLCLTCSLIKIRAGKISREPVLRVLEKHMARLEKLVEIESKEGRPHGILPDPLPLRRQ